MMDRSGTPLAGNGLEKNNVRGVPAQACPRPCNALG
jgi:hypothetical protein